MNQTAVQVRRLAATGRYKTMVALAEDVEPKVTKQRVHQIIRSENIPWADYHVLLEWDCPGCGAAIAIGRAAFYAKKSWNHMPAHCRKCSMRDRAEFCKRGHLRSENVNKWGWCLQCARVYNRCVTEVRACAKCGKALNISRGTLRQIKQGNARGKFHMACYRSSRS